jgi:OOP family OmpA-OmpF porin
MKLRGSLVSVILSMLPFGALAQPISGIYVGTGAGVSFYQDGGVNSLSFPASGQVVGGGPGRSGSGKSQGVVFTIGSVGYGFGNGFRVELQGDWRLTKINIASGFPATGNEEQYGGFINGLYDFNIKFAFPGLHPYIGAGFGYEQVHLDDVTALGTVSPGGIKLRSNGSDGGPAAQAILGLAYDVQSVPGLALTAEYRYTQIIGNLVYNGVGTTASGIRGSATFGLNENYNHTAVFGIRYAFDQPPAAVAAPPAPIVPAQALSAARSYLIFFDWDRADLTDRARQIVAEAARVSVSQQTTRIDVNGYADTSGTPKYNTGLSERRANVVAAELVKDGVPAAGITIRGSGETHPLVPTGNGVREPQNRRVEIILG